jgi:predicted ferric reductase
MLDHPYWYAGRATGLVAYVLLAASTALGLAISSRIFDGVLNRAWVYEMHRFVSVLVTLLAAAHAFVMLPDPFAGFSLADVLVPLWSGYKQGPMALGIVALYVCMLITATSYMTRRIGQRAWRAVHYLTFVLFLVATGHGVWTGSDSGLLPAQAMYYSASLLVLFLTFYRILALKNPKQAQRGVAPPQRPVAVTAAVRSAGESPERLAS